jgi:glycerophosphoryl diester phosphodiesterase
MRRLFGVVALAVGIGLAHAAERPRSVNGYITEVLPEPELIRQVRHQKVAERRKGLCVIVHRGASAFAPENTLEAYAAAMDYGADGCEVDIRRTADGVLVLFHDDMLDHLTNGFGTVDDLTYFELLSLKPRFVYGAADRQTRPPTFAALLVLAQQRAMLLHLDVKQKGLEADIAKLLDAADVWDHVVVVNTDTAPTLAKDPGVRLLRFKVSGLYDGRKDLDPDAVRAALAKPGDAIMVDDPRVAARELKRPAYAPEHLPKGLRTGVSPPSALPDTPARNEVEGAPPRIPASYLRRRVPELERLSAEELVRLLGAGPASERIEVDGPGDYRVRRTERILDRAWAAQRLGELGKKTPEIVAALEMLVRNRSLHRDWIYHGLDGAMAVRALAALGARESAPVLIDAFRRTDPALERVVNRSFGPYPLAWTDFRPKMYVLPALGDLPCEASKQFLMEYVALPEARVRELSPPAYDEATKALMKQPLSPTEIEALLRSSNGAVRGTALLECLDRPSTARTAALRAAAPWAIDIPRARR